MVPENIKYCIENLKKRSDEISEQRKELLDSFANYIYNKVNEKQEVKLIFICTHNSRRSIMSQIWAQTASEYFEIPNIVCYSGGTEVTAFNPRAVEAVEKAGFKVEKKDDSENPIYLVYYSDDKEPLECFSKVYNDQYNPQKDFAAIMTCSDADANCPVVFGAEARFPIRYNDPKEFDGTKLETSKYAEHFDEIGKEMLFVFEMVSKKIN
ncbi:MAG: protein-tyrosine-phosphatase [Chlorobi bacterium]|nr:protein-tyrosine-phosphatase [Chlorobiota bacterium]